MWLQENFFPFSLTTAGETMQLLLNKICILFLPSLYSIKDIGQGQWRQSLSEKNVLFTYFLPNR